MNRVRNSLFMIFLGSSGLLSICTNLGCQKLSPGTDKFMNRELDKLTDVYPHTFEFKNKTHGNFYFADTGLCSKCHREGLGRQPGSQAPACTMCHEFPHSWKKPISHGEKFIDAIHGNGVPIGCQTCHAENSEFKRKFPDQFVSCSKCHLEMPHPDLENFTNGGHADLAADYSKGHCLQCHQDLTHNLPHQQNGCYTCHGDPTKNHLVITTGSDGKEKAHWEETPH